MKITDYPSVQDLTSNNIFLIDGPEGTKQITAKDAAAALVALAGGGINNKETYYGILDKFASVEVRRNTFRGDSLGNAFTKEQAQHIVDGTFKGFFVGDYWEINGTTWRIVDINYWIGTGNVECTTPHLVIMSDHVLFTSGMNESDTTNGGYINSSLYKNSILGRATEAAKLSFGSNNILVHKEYLTNAVSSSGVPSGGSWFDSLVELPNEIVMFGSYIYTPGNTGSISVSRATIDKTQFALMRIYPSYITPHREQAWLRDVVNATNFAIITSEGNPSSHGASNILGIRPVFGITGAGLAA